MAIEITRMSSKGQIVLPLAIRQRMNLQEGEVFAVSAKDNLLVLKKVENSQTEEDLETLHEIQEAWKEIEGGRSRKMSSKEFLKELATW
jgi:AbrB family looped-hinge helix DNA binding protein